MKYTTLSLLLFAVLSLTAQENYFQSPVDGFSKKKLSHLTLMDGSEVSGTIKKLNWKKGNFEEIKLEVNGEKVKYSPEEIKLMYIPQSGLDKFAKIHEKSFDASKWKAESELNAEYIQDGYAYFESVEVRLNKKKTQVLLLQLLNPAFGDNIRVYHDRNAKETAGIGVAGIKATGGLDKSYWIKKGDAPAYRIKKKEFSDDGEMLFGDCPEYYSEIKDDLKWKNFQKIIYDHSQKCK